MEKVTRGASRYALERIRFGEFLVERHVIDDGQLLDALADHWAGGGRLGETLAKKGILSAGDVERLAAEYHALQVVEVAPAPTIE
jgi:hypothetical protein